MYVFIIEFYDTRNLPRSLVQKACASSSLVHGLHSENKRKLVLTKSVGNSEKQRCKTICNCCVARKRLNLFVEYLLHSN